MTARNSSIDTFRLLAALGIVFIHTGARQQLPYLLPFFEMAVPYFFCISGYFLYSSSGKNSPADISAKCKKHALKLTKIFCIAYVFFVLYTVLGEVLAHHALSSFFSSFFTPNTLFSLLSSSTTMITPESALLLWFIIAEIGAYLVIMLLRKDWLFITVGVIGLIYSILASIIPALNLPYIPTWMTRGLPVFVAGYLIHRCQPYIFKVHRKVLVIFCVIIMLIGLVIRYFYLADWFPLIPLIPSFILVLLFPNVGAKTKLPELGAKCALNVYLVHTVVRFGVHHFISNEIIIWLGTFFISLIFAFVYQLLKNRVRAHVKLG